MQNQRITIKNDSFGPICHDKFTLWAKTVIINSIIGENSSIGDFSTILNSKLEGFNKISINNYIRDTFLGKYSYSQRYTQIYKSQIGKFCSISWRVTIGAPEHNYHNISTHTFTVNPFYEIFDKDNIIHNDCMDEPLQIGNDVWIGCNSTILRGIRIGDGAIVGANSLVSKDVPPYAIVVGNPARLIKFRFSDSIIERLLEIKWWNWEIEKIRTHKKLFQQELSEELLKDL